MTEESDGFKTLKDALGMMGISGPKPLKPPVTTVKTHPIQKPQWFESVATRLLQSEPPVIATGYFLVTLWIQQSPIQSKQNQIQSTLLDDSIHKTTLYIQLQKMSASKDDHVAPPAGGKQKGKGKQVKGKAGKTKKGKASFKRGNKAPVKKASLKETEDKGPASPAASASSSSSGEAPAKSWCWVCMFLYKLKYRKPC